MPILDYPGEDEDESRRSFPHQCARFSFLAPFTGLLFTFTARVLVPRLATLLGAPHPSVWTDRTCVILNYAAVFLVVTGVCLGWVGLAGGIRRRALRTIVLAVLGSSSTPC